jgi:hypothetical protein
MPLDIQQGGYADKLRRALGVRGRMPLRLDESVVPVVQVQDLDRPPYRSDAQEFGTNVFATGMAAVFNFGAIGLATSQPGAIVVDGLWVTSGAADAYSVVIGTEVDYNAIDSAPIQLTKNCEHYGDPSRAVAGALPFDLPIRTFWGRHASLRLAAPSLMSFRVGAGDDKLIPWRWILRPGWVLAVWRSTVNLEIDVNFHGTYYPDAPVS